MNRKEFADLIAKKLEGQMTKRDIQNGVFHILDLLRTSLVTGNGAEIRGFGSFQVRRYSGKKRIGIIFREFK